MKNLNELRSAVHGRDLPRVTAILASAREEYLPLAVKYARDNLSAADLTAALLPVGRLDIRTDKSVLTSSTFSESASTLGHVEDAEAHAVVAGMDPQHDGELQIVLAIGVCSIASVTPDAVERMLSRAVAPLRRRALQPWFDYIKAIEPWDTHTLAWAAELNGHVHATLEGFEAFAAGGENPPAFAWALYDRPPRMLPPHVSEAMLALSERAGSAVVSACRASMRSLPDEEWEDPGLSDRENYATYCELEHACLHRLALEVLTIFVTEMVSK